jgi:DMSO/TMAO reductase YedYZ molybdopterin-dependent catalytic subunit
LRFLSGPMFNRKLGPFRSCVPAFFGIIFLSAAGTLVLALSPSQSAAQSAPQAARLVVTGDVDHKLSLSLTDLAALPRKTMTVKDEHNGKTETYQGVSLEEIMKRAGVPQGENLRGAALATYVLAEADDGYRVLFSLAELDSGIEDSDALVADTLDGGPIPDKVGPLRLVFPHDKRPARWVRMLHSLTVVKIPK